MHKKEEIKTELNDAKVFFKKAVEEFEKWEKRKYKGEKLNEIEDELMKGSLSEKQRR
ncbi:16432_t:CDS:1, partial [Funneliformis caledonium]